MFYSCLDESNSHTFQTITVIPDGQSDVEVQLIAKKYVERGGSLTLACKHNVPLEKIYKVTWLKANNKFFEYINGRQPPYRNFSVAGAEIDVRKFLPCNSISSKWHSYVFSYPSSRNQIRMKLRWNSMTLTRRGFTVARWASNRRFSRKHPTRSKFMFFVSRA